MSEMLDTLLEEVDDAENLIPEAEKRFVVDSDDAAEWCLGVIRDANREIEKWTAFYKDRIEKTVRKQNARIAHMEFLLEGYFRSVPHDETKTQLNYKLPGGKLVMKKPALVLEHDDEQLLPWLKENGFDEYIKIKESLDWAALKKKIEIPKHEENGKTVLDAIIPCGDFAVSITGVTVVEKPAEFKVEVKA